MIQTRKPFKMSWETKNISYWFKMSKQSFNKITLRLNTVHFNMSASKFTSMQQKLRRKELKIFNRFWWIEQPQILMFSSNICWTTWLRDLWPTTTWLLKLKVKMMMKITIFPYILSITIRNPSISSYSIPLMKFSIIINIP